MCSGSPISSFGHFIQKLNSRVSDQCSPLDDSITNPNQFEYPSPEQPNRNYNLTTQETELEQKNENENTDLQQFHDYLNKQIDYLLSIDLIEEQDKDKNFIPRQMEQGLISLKRGIILFNKNALLSNHKKIKEDDIDAFFKKDYYVFKNRKSVENDPDFLRIYNAFNSPTFPKRWSYRVHKNKKNLPLQKDKSFIQTDSSTIDLNELEERINLIDDDYDNIFNNECFGFFDNDCINENLGSTF